MNPSEKNKKEDVRDKKMKTSEGRNTCLWTKGGTVTQSIKLVKNYLATRREEISDEEERSIEE